MIRKILHLLNLNSLPYKTLYWLVGLNLIFILLDDLLFVRDVVMTPWFFIVFIAMLFVFVFGPVVTLAYGMSRPIVYFALHKLTKSYLASNLHYHFAKLPEFRRNLFYSLISALTGWVLLFGLLGILTGFTMYLLWMPHCVRLVFLVYLITVVLMTRYEKWILTIIIATIPTFLMWLWVGLADQVAAWSMLPVAALILAVALFFRRRYMRHFRPISLVVIIGMGIVCFLFSVGHIYKSYNPDLDHWVVDHIILQRFQDREVRQDLTSENWGQALNPTASMEKSNLYDFVPDPETNRLYFVDKERRTIGYVVLHEDFEGYDEVSRHWGWMEQIVVGKEGNLQDGKSTGFVFSNYHGALTRHYADDLEIKSRCPFLIMMDLPDVIKGLRILDMAAIPYTDYIGSIIEFSRYLYVQHKTECDLIPVEMPTWVPYQVLCSEKLKKCFISGWLMSSYLSEVSYTLEPLAFKSRGVKIGMWSMGMNLNQNHSKLLVTRSLAGSVDVLDTETLERIRRIRIQPMVRQIAYAPNLDILFTANFWSGRIVMYSFKTGKKLGEFSVGPYVRKIDWNEELSSLFITDAIRIYRFTKTDITTVLSNSP